jgi:arginine repressor
MNPIEFMGKNSPIKKSKKLDRHKEAIILLSNKNYSARQILEYLHLNGCNVSQQTLYRFLQKIKESSPSNTHATTIEKENTSSFNWDELKNVDPETLY